ncbi:MAG: hypothetical protein AB7F19_00535 [Candidatus Babeliales bacterium]
MIKYLCTLLLLLLLVVPYCHAMDSDGDEEYILGGKRGRPISPVEQSAASADEDGPKYSRVMTQNSVQKNMYYAVNPIDSTTINASVDRTAFMLTYMSQLVRSRGVTLPTVAAEIKALMQAQDNDALRERKTDLMPYCMQCPDCDVVLQSEVSEKKLLSNMFKHWFLGAKHQPLLYEHMTKLIARSKETARKLFDKYQLPQAAVVPLPQAVSAVHENNARQTQGVQHEPARAWYIVSPHPENSNMATLFRSESREEVVALYLSTKIPHLTPECADVQAQGQLLRMQDELLKQMMVQINNQRKNVICPHDSCEHMLTLEEDVTERSISALFAQLALHHMQSHPIESTNVLAKKAKLRAATSFDKAEAKAKLK